MFNFNYDPIIPVSPTIPYAYKPSTIATALKKEMFSDNIISNLIRNSMLKKEESDLKNVNLCLTSLSDIITSKQHYEINIKISKSYIETNYKINSASPDLLILIANICEAEFKNDKSETSYTYRLFLTAQTAQKQILFVFFHFVNGRFSF
jgi:hypothetical protein